MLKRAGVEIVPDISVYRVRVFEIADEMRDKWFGEDDMKHKHDFFIVGDDELFEKLDELGIPIDCLDSARLSDYPL
jgi:hypothetical protein